MNELEKTIPREGNVKNQNAPEAPVSSAQAEATENVPAETATAENAETAPALLTTDPGTEEKADSHKYFQMTKSELADTLAAIVEAKEADRHKEVAAIKQAFYLLRNAELEAEAMKFAEEAQPGDSFVSATDPEEVRFKDLLASFREMRNAYLAAEEERRINNLAKKNEIIDRLKAIAADIDNINLHINEVRQLQEDFKTISDIPAGAVNESWKNYQLVVE